VIFSYRIVAVGFGISSLIVTSIGCSDDNSASSPVSPSTVPQLADTSDTSGLNQTPTVVNLDSLGTDAVTLKATAPTPTTPTNGATDIPCTTTQCAKDRAANKEAVAVAPTLTVTNATGTYVTHSFSYAFALYKGSTLIETTRIDEGSGSTSYQITELLDAETTYSWKARAVLNDGTSDTYGPWSTTFTFTTAAAPIPPKAVVVIGTPTPTFPINGETITDFTPHLSVTNGVNEGTAADIGQIIYEIQLATSPSVSAVLVTASTHARTGSTRIALRPAGQSFETELSASTTYYWRARGKNDGVKTHFTPDNSVVVVDPSDWTEWQVFKTADASATGANAPYNCCPPANRLSVVQQVAAEIGYPGSGVDVRTLTQRVAEKLYAEDNRWGRRINITGPLGKDTVAYKADDGRPYSIDIVSGAGSANPKVHWDPHGFVGGTWVKP